MSWDLSGDPSVIGYRLYEGTESEVYTAVFDVAGLHMVKIIGLVPGATYYFAVTAYDGAGGESPFSGEITYAVPQSPPPIGPSVLSPIIKNASGQTILRGTGPAGAVYDICATSDCSSWVVIGSVTVDPSGEFQFTDQFSSAIPWRFYRLGEHSP